MYDFLLIIIIIVNRTRSIHTR